MLSPVNSQSPLVGRTVVHSNGGVPLVQQQGVGNDEVLPLNDCNNAAAAVEFPVPVAGAGSPVVGVDSGSQAARLEGPAASVGTGAGSGSRATLEEVPGAREQQVGRAIPSTQSLSRSSLCSQADRGLSYAQAGNTLHHIFGHSKQAEMFAWKIGKEPLLEACSAAAQNCVCQENAVRLPQSHAREPARERGDIQVDIQHIRGMYLLVGVDRFSRYRLLTILPGMQEHQLLMGLQSLLPGFGVYTKVQADLQFDCLIKLADQLPCKLVVVPRESHGQQGAVERSIREVKTVVLAARSVPVVASALEKAAWCKGIEEQLNHRVTYYYDGVAVSPLALQFGMLSQDVVAACLKKADRVFSRLRRKDKGWKMLRPQVGLRVRMWKEPSLPGKRGKWQDGQVTHVEEANHSCLVALESNPKHVYRLSWAHVKERRPTAIWPEDGPDPPLEGDEQDESQAADANPPCLDYGLSWMDEGEQESAETSVTRPEVARAAPQSRGLLMADIIRALQNSKRDPKMLSPSWRRRLSCNTLCFVGSWPPRGEGQSRPNSLALGGRHPSGLGSHVVADSRSFRVQTHSAGQGSGWSHSPG
eukprot:jgi/Mesvir1/20696/Mv25513-RA.1